MRDLYETDDEMTGHDGRTPVPAAMLIGALLGTLGLLMVAGEMVATPGKIEIKWFAVGVVALSGGIWVGWTARSDASPRWRRAIVVYAASVCALLGAGALMQLTLNGRPVLVTSGEARAHEIVAELYGDIVTMGRHDELLVASPADARARYNSYEPAAQELRRIAGKWSRVDLGELPDPDLIEVVQHVKTGATFGSQALELRYVLITEPDSRNEALMAENRAAFMAETISAGAKLRPLAEKYGVDTVPAGGLE